MDDPHLRLLLVEADPREAGLLRGYLDAVDGLSFSLEHADRLCSALGQLSACHFDAVLLDLDLPDSYGVATFQQVRQSFPDTPVVVLSPSNGDVLAKAAVRAGAEDYIGKAEMGAHALERSIRYVVARAGRRRAEQTLSNTHLEFSLARRIQQGLYPRDMPHIPSYEIAGASYPSVSVAGDYFDFIPMTDGSLGIAIGDASGHGLGPALLMAEVRATLRTLVRSYHGVSEILGLANQILYDGTPDDYFITLLFLRLDFHAGVMVFASAGHPSGLLLDSDGRLRMKLDSTALPLGLDREQRFDTGPSILLHAGDTLLLYSDGVVEAFDERTRQFGVGGVLSTVQAMVREPAATIVDGLRRAVLAHCGPMPPQDDMTVVVIKSLPPDAP